MTDTIFVTGFPGFIASRLLRRLAREDAQFILLVQPRFSELAACETRRIAEEESRNLKDFRLIQGDITEPNLGMSQNDLEMIRFETSVIFHLAAIYDLAVSRDVAMFVNVQGSRNVNQFARLLPKLNFYHYVSTCYVAGKREGLILETELQHGAGFRNYYEETKYLAEQEADSLKGELPLVIHRPAVVCGDSRTGETVKYDGVYYLIRYLLRWPGLLSLFNIGNDRVRLNLVPVDFVVESFAALACDSEAIGKTLQLADPNPLTTRELFDVIAKSIGGHHSLVTVPPAVVQFTLKLPPSPAITGLPHHGVPYFFVKQSYDSSEAQRLLTAHNISCPPFESYVDNIVKYAASHADLKK